MSHSLATATRSSDEQLAGVVRRLDACLDRLAARRNVAHAVFAVRRGDGGIDWRGARGHAQPDGPAMTTDTPFFVASIDKLVTATATLALAERQRIDLDAPMTAYLAGDSARGLHVLGGVDRTDQITVRHLLSHTSGLADYLEDRPRGGRSLIEETLAAGDRGWPREAAFARVRERLRPHFVPQDLTDPRARVRYSDTNYLALKAVLEAVEGWSLARVYRTRVFEPLGMHDTWIASREDPQDERTAAAATVWAGRRPFVAPATLRSLPAMYSTLGDQLRLIRGVTSGLPFDRGAETFTHMATPFRRFGQAFDATALRQPGWPIAYAHGLMRFELPRWLAPVGRPPAVIGHTGSTGAWAFHVPDADVDLVGTVDQVTAGAVPFRSWAAWWRAISGPA